jgi:hypothetical protein
MNFRIDLEQKHKLIYHELGHLIGYILADKNPATSLGNIAKFEIGITNQVLPKDTLYHFGNFSEEWNKVFENTKNHERTLAWFIEVILGCTMQSLYENCDFTDCFGYEAPKTGSVDFANICAIQGILSFEFTFDLIYRLQVEIQNLIIKYDLLEKLKPVISNLKEYFFNSSDHQISLKEEELSRLIDTVDNLLELPFVDEYFHVINKYSDGLNPAS